MVAPMTLCPCSTRSAAAREESTPPDIATRTVSLPSFIHHSFRSPVREASWAGEFTDPRHHPDEPLGGLLHVALGRRAPEGEPDRRPVSPWVAPHGDEDVTGLDRPALARRAARDGQPLE